MKKAHLLSALIAAIAFIGFVYAHDYYNDDVGATEKYIFQFLFFGGGLLVFDFVMFRKRKK